MIYLLKLKNSPGGLICYLEKMELEVNFSEQEILREEVESLQTVKGRLQSR